MVKSGQFITKRKATESQLRNGKYHFCKTPFRSLSTPLPARSCGKLVDVKF